MKLSIIWGKVFLWKFQQEEEGEETQDEVSESQGTKDSKSRLQEKVRTQELSRISSVFAAYVMLFWKELRFIIKIIKIQYFFCLSICLDFLPHLYQEFTEVVCT